MTASTGRPKPLATKGVNNEFAVSMSIRRAGEKRFDQVPKGGRPGVYCAGEGGGEKKRLREAFDGFAKREKTSKVVDAARAAGRAFFWCPLRGKFV